MRAALAWAAAWLLALAELASGALSQNAVPVDPASTARVLGVICGLVAMGGCLWTAFRLDGWPRRIWICFAAACGLWLVFQLLHSLGATSPGRPIVSDSWIHVGWLGSSIAQVAALFLLVARAEEPYLVIRRLCQLGILLVCGYAIVAFPLHEMITRPDLPMLDALVLVGYVTIEPAGAVFALASLIARGDASVSRAVVLLIGGSVLRSSAFLLQGLAILTGNDVDHPAALPLWAAGFALTFAAAWATPRPQAAQEAAERSPQDAMRARAVEITLPILAVIAVVVSRLLTREPIDTEEAAVIIVPTLFGIVLMFSIGEWCDRANQARLRRNAEAASDTLGAILNIVPDAVIGVDQHGAIRLVNRSGEVLLGYDPGELLGRQMEILIPEVLRQRHSALVEDFRDQRLALRMGNERAPIPVLRRDGSQFFAEAWLQRLTRESEIWFIISLRDISAQLTHARELRDASRAAEVANRAKSEFLANMSHELRTPLNAIIGFSEVIEGQVLGESIARDRDYAREIHRAGLHLLEIINDILDLSKIEAGRLELHEAPVDVAQLIDSCLRLVKERAERGGVTVTAELAACLPILVADEVKLKQILINLLSNGIKFTPIGGRASISAHPHDGGLLITVRDTGIGMKKEDIPKAMAVFGQVDSGIARLHEGTGLGLPLSRKLAELHQAEFSIESAPGAGTTVSILFPRHRLGTGMVATPAMTANG
ncbi:MAG: PAS domain S-box protein [Rhodospirillaceae bacterium]|nr:PAS domain S-box protein [Rhodospirillaceae bacterium]